MKTTNLTHIVSFHAVQRLQERAYPGLRFAEAERYIRQLLDEGTVLECPRRWLKGHVPHPGTRYVISSHEPDVCLVLTGRIVTTVLVREMFTGRRFARPERRPLELPRRRFNWRQDLAAEDLDLAVTA